MPLRSTTRSASRIAGSVMGRFLTPAVVEDVVDHGPGPSLRTLTLTTPKPLSWTPGDRVRIAVGGVSLRTYTPSRVEAGEPSTVTILVHMAGTGPGSEWCAAAAPGDECRFLGPQKSIELPKHTPAPIVVGDETSLGLHLAQGEVAAGAPTAIFEVDDPEAVGIALDHHGAAPSTLVTRAPCDGHLDLLKAAVLDALADRPDTNLCLTGRAQTIAGLRRALKDAGLAPRTAVAKAYWDVNRSGLE